MSEQSQGPGWWLASDGRWYPPDQAPAVPPPETWAAPPVGPPPGGMPTGAKVAIAVVGGFLGLIVVLVLVVALLGEESETGFERAGTAIDGGDLAPSAAEVPDGFALIEGDGVSIAAPEGWEEVDPGDFDMSPEELEEAFPDASPEFLEQATSAFAEGAKLVAFEVAENFSSNVNVASFPGEVPLSLLEDQAVAQLETLGGTLVSADPVTLPAGKGLRIEYTLGVAAPDGSSVPASGVQYYVVDDGHTHVVTITTGEDVGPLADTMIDTFRAE